MIQRPATSTSRRASSALRPEITTTCTFGVSAKSARSCRVSFGTAAYSGRSAMGASVPSTSRSSTNGEPRSLASIAAVRGSAGIAGASGKRGLAAHDFRGPRQNRVEPVEDRRIVKLPAHATHAPSALVRRHLERGANGGNEPVDVEWIDQNRAFDLLRRSSKSTENQNTVLFRLAGNELLSHQVHPVLQRRYDA